MRFLLFTILMLTATFCAAQETSFRIAPDASGQFSSGIRSAPAYVDARVLAAGVSETHTVPTGQKRVLFSATCDFYAKPGASAAVPAADVTDGTSAELNPATWTVEDMTQFTIISSSVCVVTLSFYKK